MVWESYCHRGDSGRLRVLIVLIVIFSCQGGDNGGLRVLLVMIVIISIQGGDSGGESEVAKRSHT